jgi:hypothetical protein
MNGSQKMLFETEASLGQYGQPILPEPVLARTTDPQPSHSAADKIGTKLHELHKLFLVALGKSHLPATSQEVAADAVPIDGTIGIQEALTKRESIRKRARELFDNQYITKQADRICQVTGNRAATYQLTKKGRDLIKP